MSTQNDDMTDAERAERLEMLADSLAGKCAAMQEALGRVNDRVNILLDAGQRASDQDARAFSNAHALMFIEALGEHRSRPGVTGESA